MSFGKPPWTFDEHNQPENIIDADGNHIGKMKTAEMAAIAVAAVNCVPVDRENERKAALWDRLVAAWKADGAIPLGDTGEPVILGTIDELIAEWQGWLAPRPPEPAFYDDDNPAPPVPGEFSNRVDWTAGIGRMGEIKAQAEALVAAAEGPYQHCAVLTGWYREEVAADTSTRICPCGDRFTWSGLSPDLEPWMTEHVRHAIVPMHLVELRNMLAQAERVAAALATQAELAADLRSDLQINLNRMPKP